MTDPLPSPLSEQVGGSHYKDMPIQPAHFIRLNSIPYHEGCVIKYVCRHRTKNGREDIEKAIHYLQMILEEDYGGTIGKGFDELHKAMDAMTDDQLMAELKEEAPSTNPDEQVCRWGLLDSRVSRVDYASSCGHRKCIPMSSPLPETCPGCQRRVVAE